MSEIEIRTLTADDWATYKSVRLASLEDSADSFGSTYEREALFPDSEWQSRLEATGRANNTLPLIAERDGIPIGLSWGLINELGSDVAHIYQMWVSPDARGNGIGKLFLDHIAAWAIAKNCGFLELSVTITNDAAFGLYQTSGFVPSGQTEKLREGSELKTQIMVKALRKAL
jgi:ribosomal protein S18 acetylase RimI-like enzyme